MINRYKKDSIIRTQADLNKAMEFEKDLYYISLNGSIASFNGETRLSLSEVNSRLDQISRGSSEAISDAMAEGNYTEAAQFMDAVMKTYVLPYRMH